MKGLSRIGFACAVLVVSWAAASCSSPQTLGGVGASCLVFTDCEADLVCAPVGSASGPSGPKECTTNTATLVEMEDAGAAAAKDAGPAATDGAAAPDAPAAPDEGAPPDEAAPPAAADAGEET